MQQQQQDDGVNREQRRQAKKQNKQRASSAAAKGFASPQDAIAKVCVRHFVCLHLCSRDRGRGFGPCMLACLPACLLTLLEPLKRMQNVALQAAHVLEA